VGTRLQVKMVEILAATATAADTFSRRMVHQCLEGVATLLGGHIRGRAPAGDCLTAFTEAVGPAFVFKNLPKVAASCTNPKILQVREEHTSYDMFFSVEFRTGNQNNSGIHAGNCC
jgi:hypothetical protein